MMLFMRTVCLAALLFSGCGKGESSDRETRPVTQAPSAQVENDAQVQEALSNDEQLPQPPKRTWKEVVEKANALQQRWATLKGDEQTAFYQEWTRETQELIKVLQEEADSDELDALYHQEPRSPVLQFSAEEGFAYAAIVSPAWLLRTFPNLPKAERDYLTWIAKTDRDAWFAEGMLEVSVPEMTSSYQSGALLLAQYKDGFRASDIGTELDGMMWDICSLLSQPPAYAKKKYQKHLAAAFVAMANVERHKSTARAFMRKLPVKGAPYSFDQVESLREELGLTK